MATTAALPVDAAHVVRFEPVADMSVVHHMLLYLCPTLPLVSQASGALGAGMHRRCAAGEMLAYGWGRNAAELALPEGVGFEVGGDGFRWAVLEARLFTRPPRPSPLLTRAPVFRTGALPAPARRRRRARLVRRDPAPDPRAPAARRRPPRLRLRLFHSRSHSRIHRRHLLLLRRAAAAHRFGLSRARARAGPHGVPGAGPGGGGGLGGRARAAAATAIRRCCCAARRCCRRRLSP